MTEKEYRDYPAINYSLLSKISVSPVGLDDKEETSYFTMGSLVDCLCTTPEVFNDLYYITTAPVPSDAMVAYSKALAETGDKDAAWTASGLKSDPDVAPKSSKDGKSKFEKEAKAYYNDLVQGKGKQVISFEENATANNLASTLKTNEFTSKYFKKENMFQTAIVWKYYGRECKSLLDIIDIDHERKTIRPVDLKTIGKSVFSFYRSYIDYKYYLQAAFYTAALEYAMEHDVRFSGVSDYKVLPFQFVVIETNYKNPPHIFEVDDADLYAAEHGGIVVNLNYGIKGFKELIENLEYHQTTSQWDYRQEVYAEGGVLTLQSLVASE